LTRRDRTPAAAAVYCRISSDPEGLRAGVERQREDCLALASRRGWTIAREYIDNDLSAWNGKARLNYSQMLADIKAGQIDAVIVWHLDRLHRSPRELEEFVDTCQAAGLRDVATVTGDIDLAEGDGLFQARILTAVARKESDDKSRRIRRKHMELAKNGHPAWGIAVPFGYEYDSETRELHAHPKQAPIVKEIFKRYARGWTLKAITHDLNKRRVVGQRGKRQWHSSHVARILDNPAHAGFRRHRGELHKGNWKPLVDRKTWEMVQSLRMATKAKPAQNHLGHGQKMLSGLLFCSCGAPMWRDTYTSRDSQSAYVCARAKRKKRGDCTAGSISALRVEREVGEAFLERVSSPYAAKALEAPARLFPTDPHEEGVEKELADIERRMEAALEMALDNPAPVAQKAFKKKIAELEERRAELENKRARDVAAEVARERKVADLRELRKRVSDLPAIWEQATASERNEILRLLIERIELIPSTRPKRIEIRWGSEEVFLFRPPE
jgi:site-specific DNA recombinase